MELHNEVENVTEICTTSSTVKTYLYNQNKFENNTHFVQLIKENN